MFLSNGGHETVIRAMASTSRSGFLTREWALFFWSKLRDFNMATRKESDAVTDPGLSAGIKTGRRDFLKAAVTIAGAVAFGAATMPRVFLPAGHLKLPVQNLGLLPSRMLHHCLLLLKKVFLPNTA
ncbi:MAG TPA: twin-arginine translocation signal domain-containing protein [Pseudohongiella sp.]|nr:twin-arginine translocation signal domain-containing protein [Pseudohongiella sp.]